MKDNCVLCEAKTPYDKEEHIDNRLYYVESSGQLCETCFKSIY